MQHAKVILSAALTLAFVGASAAGAAQTTKRPAYGCLKVSSASTPILDKSNKSGSVIATAGKGDVLVKAKRFCGLRGYCSVSYKSMAGWVDKANVKAAPCPASMSKPVN